MLAVELLARQCLGFAGAGVQADLAYHPPHLGADHHFGWFRLRLNSDSLYPIYLAADALLHVQNVALDARELDRQLLARLERLDERGWRLRRDGTGLGSLYRDDLEGDAE